MKLKRLFSICGITLALTVHYGCTHIMPHPVRTMPIVKVLHNEKTIELPLEKYVASVLAGEVHPSWAQNALKAQAIAARTYVMRRVQERRYAPYHIRNSVQDQVIRLNLSDSLIRATRSTAGMVLTLDGKLAETSFHSTCGGKTTSSKSVWGRAYSHLTGGECGYCTRSPTYQWETQIPLHEIENTFQQKISQIAILSRTKDGRIHQLRLNGSASKIITGHAFRTRMGTMRIKSTFISDISIKEDAVRFIGHGFGHGVGMCQYGALGMARSGKLFYEILAHYYPGTKITRIY